VTVSRLKNLDLPGAQSGNATSLYCRAVSFNKFPIK
jgi:hypothetical protein